MNTRAELNTLEAGGLIEIAALQPDLEYLFRHALVQDAAYSSLLKQDRRTLHLAAGDTLVDLHKGRESELAAVIAMHFEQGGDGRRAAEYLVLAGEHAMRRFANSEAIAFFRRAISVSDPSQSDLRLRAAIGFARAGWGFSTDMVTAELENAIAGGKDADKNLLTEAYFWLAFLRRMAGETEESSPALREALARAKELGGEVSDPAATAVPRALMGAFAAFAGQLREGAHDMSEALGVIEAKGDPVSAAMVANFLAGAYSRLGDFAAAEKIIDVSTRFAEKGDAIAIVDRDIALAGFHLERGEPQEAGLSSVACSTRAEELGAFACVLASNVITGASHIALHDAEGAKGPLDRGSELTRVVNFAPLRTMTYALLGSVRAQLGDEPGAVADWNEALASAQAMSDRYGEAQTLWGRGRALARRPDADLAAALDDIEKAMHLFEAMEARPAFARTLLDRARVLRLLGREDEAADDERRSHELARELGLRDIAPQ